jgi:Holliday junction resolvase RusA-like endonuclease
MTAPVLHLTVYGVPKPQGSHRPMISKSTGRPFLKEQVEGLGPWRDNVRHEALLAVGGYSETTMAPLNQPVVVDMVFTFDRPGSHYRTGRNAHLLRDGAPARPDVSPDLSKLARAVEDALTDARVWTNDARVVEYGRLAKVYVGEDGDALDRPGVLIRVWTLAQLDPRAARGIPVLVLTEDGLQPLFPLESPPGPGDARQVPGPGRGAA